MSKISTNQVIESTDTNRIIGNIDGSKNSPTVIIFAGIHGNEIAGVKASKIVLHKIKENNISFEGNLFILLGNMNAIKKDIRFENVDLNRIWNKENIHENSRNNDVDNSEKLEQMDIYAQMKEIMQQTSGPFYFLDLHTTSAPSVPFITISDSLNNRKFSKKFPLPVVLGIEEYLDGPLLTFINEFGHIALGFEGGQHHDEKSVANCEAFIWKALVHSKCVSKKNIPDFKKYQKHLSDLCCKYEFFEIIYRYEIKKGEHFLMNPGFKNFEPVEKDQLLAKSDDYPVIADENSRVFMPLYQEQGEDGYFLLSKISKFWLNSSIIARRLKINHFLRLIPGVHKDLDNNYTLIVDPKIAKYMAKDIFHLFGYRRQIFKDDKFHFIKRDRKVTDLL